MTALRPRDKWIAALRSGEYRQGKSYLRDGDRFCCLGVACELYKAEHPLKVKRDDNDIYSYGGMDKRLPDRVRKWLGLRDDEGVYNGESALSADNDSGKTFKQIARIIKREPEGLFKS